MYPLGGGIRQALRFLGGKSKTSARRNAPVIPAAWKAEIPDEAPPGAVRQTKVPRQSPLDKTPSCAIIKPQSLFQGGVKVPTGGTVREPVQAGRMGAIPIPTV